MKVLWVGDAVVSSGFARCTHAACDALHDAGHKVMVLGINYWGDPHPHPYPIFPCHQPLDGGREPFGTTRLPVLIERYKPDVVVILQDPWNIPDYLGVIEGFVEKRREQGVEVKVPPIVGWLAVDAKNQRGVPLNELAHVAVWTRFAAEELKRCGYDGEPSIIPLGVDLESFYPRDPVESRKRVMPEGFPQHAFVVGVVGRNQPRKRLDLTLTYFAEWIETKGIEDAYLYLHIGPTGDVGCNIRALAAYLKIPKGRIILAEPHIGKGIPSDLMAEVYSAFDVYWTTTQGEGWGLPCLEAMACGVPCLVPNWSGLGSWVGDAAVKVACTSTALSAPLNTQAYTLGGIPDRAETIQALDALYRSEIHRRTYSQRGLKLAQTLPWSRTGAEMVAALEKVVAASQASVAAEEAAAEDGAKEAAG